jgi:EAL domain-containing protein (putative c-di-GMP-specific phosphodiesterase class I)/CheY-like chemotaxis protein
MEDSRDPVVSPPIDRAVLAAISRGDPLVERRLLSAFHRANVQDADALRVALDARNMSAVTRAAHRVMGASRMAGAVALAGICNTIAQAGQSGDWAAVAASRSALEFELERVSTHIEAQLREDVAAKGFIDIAEVQFLVVEDQAFERELLVCMLAGLGAIHIAEAADGRAALDEMSRRDVPVNIIISDLDMPGMDGMEFIRHIGDADLPSGVILISAHDRALLASVATMTEDYGVQLLGTVEKPIEVQRLAELIKRYQPAVQKRRAQVAGTSFSGKDISDALAARMFEPLFQPKVDIATGVVKGAEALARWYHPQFGMVGPYAFIATMEANQCIDELTWIMLEKSALACCGWRAQGLDVQVSVNLSLASLARIGLADRITEIVQAQDLDPRYMTLEVTETIAMTDMAHALENLARLRIRGFGLSIDDYGTGYSSMQQLSRIPFTELKIDQSFVMNAREKESCRVILESSLDIARKLGLKAVAEGVETRADWDLLDKLGCAVAQGYFVAKPMEAANFAAWVAAWKLPGRTL